MLKLGGGWDELLIPIFTDSKYLKIRDFLKQEYTSNNTIYPDMYDIYNCFKYTPYDKIKAVILGQDPYHGEGQAHGLCFSVKSGMTKPPSLNNIFKELYSDLNITIPDNGELTKWAHNGILLLNSSLTVRANNANSHSKCGWEWFTDEVIKLVDKREKPVVFILWGNNARSKKKYIDEKKHYIIESAHPSPLSCYNGFFGSKPFSKANEFLESKNQEKINWSLD
jgi:uracil-DNA glycosylase